VTMKIQTMKELFDQMRAVAYGEIPAPPDAAEPSMEPTEALRRNAIDPIPGDTEVTIGAIAKLLNVSPPYAIKLLDEGRIPSYGVGVDRRARFKDVMDYRDEHYKARKAVLDQMSAIDQELGLI
jgi:excisionase family DNA binding protein